ncbi:hypothetical protein V2J09_020189 [Rumex salicifolius]
MADATGQRLFRKELTMTDLDHRLHWPAEQLGELPNFNGGHKVEFPVKDKDGTFWNFMCSKRKTGPYEKPVVSAGWIPFLRSKENLKAGDEVIFYRSEDPRAHFEIRLKRKVLIFGCNINNLEI